MRTPLFADVTCLDDSRNQLASKRRTSAHSPQTVRILKNRDHYDDCAVWGPWVVVKMGDRNEPADFSVDRWQSHDVGFEIPGSLPVPGGHAGNPGVDTF